ncbi:MAG: tRNA-(ms[2]io[6]A)-hydroxylase [Bacteroidetes bacterium]|nr:tRNA-(ms[2]io[6]A)-hydroxylase [Bacteroidota bacterium]
MLCLKVPSQPSWIEAARADLDRVLLDHAHCEKKAAVNAMALVSRYPGCEMLVREMIALATEEMEHFGMVYSLLRERGVDLERDPGDPYVQALHREVHQNEPQRMMDLLLVAALVEARSCERFSVLSKHVPDESLREFYRSLLASEAGHYRTFYDIACEYYPERDVRARLDALAAREAEIVLALASAPTMHG